MNQLLGAGELLKYAWEDYKTKVKTLAALMAGFYVFLGVVMLIATGGTLARSFSAENLSAGGVVMYIIGILIVVIVGILVEVSLIYLAAGAEISIKSALKRARGKFFAFIALAILLGLTIIGGLILLVIPGLIFLVWFSFSYFILLFEDKRAVDSMKQSKKYVKGRFWPVAGRLIAIVAVMIPFWIISGLFGDESIVSFIADAIVGIFVGPFAVVYMYHLYRNVKETVSQVAQPQQSMQVQV